MPASCLPTSSRFLQIKGLRRCVLEHGGHALILTTLLTELFYRSYGLIWQSMLPQTIR